jgi:hypothetical protein
MVAYTAYTAYTAYYYIRLVPAYSNRLVPAYLACSIVFSENTAKIGLS